MQKSKLLSLLVVAMLMISSAFAQVAQDTSKNADPSLKGQYEFMLSKSKNLSGAKLINPYRLSTLWKSVSDTLKKERKQMETARREISAQKETITNLQKEVSGKENSLASTTAILNEISFLGISFNKTTYNTIVWTIIIVLAIGLAIVIFSSGKYRREAAYRTQLYQEVADEYQAHKVKAKDKEMRLARELQDERNKWDDSPGR